MKRGLVWVVVVLGGAWSCRANAPPEPPPARAQAWSSPPVWWDEGRRGRVDVSAPASISPEEFCPRYAEVICRKLFGCSPAASLAADAEALGVSDEAGCRAALGRACGEFTLAGVSSSVREGRARWSERQYGACFQSWVSLGCEPPWAALPETPLCRDAVEGLVSPGGRCTSAFDCAFVEKSEVACVFGEPGEGVCQRLGELGEACAGEGFCRGGLRCWEGRCRAPGAVGEGCAFDEDCQEGLRCPEEARRCAP